MDWDSVLDVICVCVGGGGGYSDVGVRFSVELRGGCCNVM